MNNCSKPRANCTASPIFHHSLANNSWGTWFQNWNQIIKENYLQSKIEWNINKNKLLFSPFIQLLPKAFTRHSTSGSKLRIVCLLSGITSASLPKVSAYLIQTEHQRCFKDLFNFLIKMSSNILHYLVCIALI